MGNGNGAQKKETLCAGPMATTRLEKNLPKRGGLRELRTVFSMEAKGTKTIQEKAPKNLKKRSKKRGRGGVLKQCGRRKEDTKGGRKCRRLKQKDSQAMGTRRARKGKKEP